MCLPTQEAKRFQNIDKNYMKIVTSAVETQNVVNTCYGNELMKTMLPHLLEQLELCQKVGVCGEGVGEGLGVAL